MIVRRLALLVRNYLILVGILAHIATFAILVKLYRSYELTPAQFASRSLEKSGIQTQWLESLLRPEAYYADHPFDGQIKSAHPRILLPEISGHDGKTPHPILNQRKQLLRQKGIDVTANCKSKALLSLSVCWVYEADHKAGRTAIDALLGAKLSTPNTSGEYGNGWELALAYDLLANHPDMTDVRRSKILQTLESALLNYLVLLDSSEASLWHGRTTLASQGWIVAVALGQDTDKRTRMAANAQGHFLDAMRALTITEAWPEGYTYWINTRAFIVALASSAYINGLQDSRFAQDIRSTLERVGLWHVYATRPDNRIQGFGDEGSRVDLKDETQRVVDLIASLTDNPALFAFSQHISGLWGREGYYRNYRWGIPLLQAAEKLDSSIAAADAMDAMTYLLPRTERFGPGAMEQIYIRSGWEPDDTFISFRAGHRFTHHGHQDAGHFTLFKGGPLAVNSSNYGNFTSENRLGYAIRTIAKNSLLILRPGEEVRPNRFFEDNIADGGQRVVLPTGSAIRNVEQWQQQIGDGLHLEGGQVSAFHRGMDYTYVAADLTRAYNTPQHDAGGSGGKVSLVKRELVYLRGEDRLIINDAVVSTDPAYTKKWLLHSVERPVIDNIRLLAGKPDNGIIESSEDRITMASGRGRLVIDRLLPEDAVVRLVGGPDYRYYVETDGDDRELDGQNLSAGSNDAPWFDQAFWRIEIQPGAARNEDHFLVVLSPSLETHRLQQVRKLQLPGLAGRGVETPESAVLFLDRHARSPVAIHLGQAVRSMYLFGIPAFRKVVLHDGVNTWEAVANNEGTLHIDFQPRVTPGTVMRLQW